MRTKDGKFYIHIDSTVHMEHREHVHKDSASPNVSLKTCLHSTEWGTLAAVAIPVQHRELGEREQLA